jgi:DNA-binding CsgD family transcriptional regulator
MSSKEIAALLKIALHTVEKHRRTARYKLNLANKGINLRTYLNSV